jgi:hypothetical protein
MWNPDGYCNRAVNPDNSVQPLADTSSNLLVALGVIDPLSGRGGSHVGAMPTNLTKHECGRARYGDDIYHVSSRFDPAGNEAGHPEPPWQVSMWVAVYETFVGDPDTALKRIQWFTFATGAGYRPQGEALNSDTAGSVLSSMSEPLTASLFLLAAPVLGGQVELRILPPGLPGGSPVHAGHDPRHDRRRHQRRLGAVGPRALLRRVDRRGGAADDDHQPR